MPPRRGSTRSTGVDDDSLSVGGASAGRGGPKHMDLKGEGSLSAIGKCVSVLYDEGGPELVAYRGVVVYVEPHRYVPFRCPLVPAPCPLTPGQGLQPLWQGVPAAELKKRERDVATFAPRPPPPSHPRAAFFFFFFFFFFSCVFFLCAFSSQDVRPL